jgi:hypothetical protein
MNCRGVTVAAGAGGRRRTPRPFCFLRTEEAEHELAGGKTATNRACARGGPVRLAQVPTATSEKDAREIHSVGLGGQVPRAVRLPGIVYEVEPHRHPERIASSYPSSVGDKPSSWARFGAKAHGGRHRVPLCIGTGWFSTFISFTRSPYFCR